MSHAFATQACRIVPPEKLPDRFLASGLLYQKEGHFIGDQVLLAYVFEITKPWFPSSKVLPTILDTLYDQHRRLIADKTLGDQFELVLRAVNEQLNAISEIGETDWIGNLNGLIMVMSGDQLHFSQTGHCPAYLLQNNRIRQITDDLPQEREPHPLKTFSNLASGVLHENDHILFANHELYREVSLDALRRVINNSSPHAASLIIAKELKKDKNQSITALILKITSRGIQENQAHPEPQEVILEEEMQSSFKKFSKRLIPVANSVKTLSNQVGQTSLRAAQQTGQLVKTKVAPKAGELFQKGMAQAKDLTNQVKGQIQKKESSPGTISTLSTPGLPVIEIILPRQERERQHRESLATQAELRVNEKYPTLDEREDAALGLDQPIQHKESTLSPSTFSEQLQPYLHAVQHWLKPAKNKKIAAISLAAFLLIITFSTVAARRNPISSGPLANENQQLLEQTEELKTKIITAIELKQDIEAAREIEEAQKNIEKLKSPTDAQRERAEQLWDTILVQADILSKTNRLSSISTQFSFPSAANSMVSSLPYFYGFSPSVPALVRTGKGESQQTQQTVALSDTTDTIISLAKSNETDTAAYLLSRKNKVYRVVQISNDTILRPITAEGNEFAAGDVISTFNGNVYILDGKTGLLWRYTNTGTSYSKGVSMIDTTKYDIKKSVSLTIDGAIYILKQDGSLLKFNRGIQEADFSLKDIPAIAQKMVQPIQVLTDETMSSIYILDAGVTSSEHSTARVMEFSKNGQFIRQYGFPKEFTKVRSFEINAKDKKLWILNGNEISEFDI